MSDVISVPSVTLNYVVWPVQGSQRVSRLNSGLSVTIVTKRVADSPNSSNHPPSIHYHVYFVMYFDQILWAARSKRWSKYSKYKHIYFFLNRANSLTNTLEGTPILFYFHLTFVITSDTNITV